jgi:two-component system, response regulator RegA
MSGLHGFISTRHDGTTRQRTALVVDSDFGSVHSLAQALRQEGLDVFEATSFQEGKFLWSTQTPDVLIVDIRLGQFNGLQLLMRARSDRPDIQAIITSPFADPVLEAETRRFGGMFLIKPVDPRHVIEAVRAVDSPEAVPTPVTPPYLLERRRADRRVVSMANFCPDRRVTDRREQPASSERRNGDRRQLVIPGYFPERRKGDRRFIARA